MSRGVSPPPCRTLRSVSTARGAARRTARRGRGLCLAALLLLPACTGARLGTAAKAPQAGGPAILPTLEAFADRLIEHARDDYGPERTPLFVSQLDVDTRSLLPDTTAFYVEPGLRAGAGPTTNNLLFDNGLVRLLDELSRLTGKPKYRAAVDDYLRYYFRHLPDPETGLFPWGDHRGYDVVRDTTTRGYHEFKVMNPPWPRYYGVDATAVRRMIEGLQLHIYDASRSYGYNRHYPVQDHRITNSMPSSAGAWIAAWAFMHRATAEAKYLDWVSRMADYHWSLRGPGTGLLAAHPYDPAYPENREYWGGLRATRTEYMAQLVNYAPQLLIAADLLGPDAGRELRARALAYVRAFTARMDVQPDGSFYATFDLETGKPLFDRITDGWAFVSQSDERFPWANRVLGIRAPIALAFAYRMTGEADLRAAFDALLPLYQLERFADGAPRLELPAGLVGQALTSFVHMYRATGEEAYLRHARTIGRYALRHYVADGWIVAGPSPLERYQDPAVDPWRTYSNRGGSAELALALLRLHLAETGRPDPVADNPMAYF